MWMYVWQPKGHGPLSFSVMAGSKKGAKRAVKKFIRENRDIPKYFTADWPEHYDLEVFSPSEVAINSND